MLREIILTLTFTKLGFVQFNVLKQQRTPGCAMDEINELTFFKSAELFAESIP
jgi:hypothetical protein